MPGELFLRNNNNDHDIKTLRNYTYRLTQSLYGIIQYKHGLTLGENIMLLFTGL